MIFPALQSVIEQLVESPVQWVGGIGGVLAALGVGIRWDRRFTKINAQLETMVPESSMREFVSAETKSVRKETVNEIRRLREDLTAITTDVQVDLREQGEELDAHRRRCAERHPKNGVGHV